MTHSIKETTNWHPEITVRNGTANFQFKGTPMGCGLVTFSNFTLIVHYNEEQIKELADYIKKHIFSYYLSNGVGAIICTLGDNYQNKPFLLFLELLKFKEVSDYKNPRHIGKYHQKLYLTNINYDQKN